MPSPRSAARSGRSCSSPLILSHPGSRAVLTAGVIVALALHAFMYGPQAAYIAEQFYSASAFDGQLSCLHARGRDRRGDRPADVHAAAVEDTHLGLCGCLHGNRARLDSGRPQARPRSASGNERALSHGRKSNRVSHPVRLPGANRSTINPMQLRVARLCLDCQEIHDQRTCPACMSESFAYISRWIPSPEPRKPPPPPAETQETADASAGAARPAPAPSTSAPAAGRWLARGVLGLAAVGIAGLALAAKAGGTTPPVAPERPKKI